MNYVTQTLIDIYNERFSHDEHYLSEKIEELKSHNNKYDGLNFLCCSADRTTIKMYSEKTQLSVEEIDFIKSIWYKI